MALLLITAPTSEPVSLDEQKTHLRIDGDYDDAYIASCIIAARQWIEGQTHRAMMAQTWDYTIDCGWPTRNGLHQIDYPINPVAVQASPVVDVITYVDTDGATQTLAASQYTVVARTNNSYVVPAYGISWPSVRNVPNAITVRFVAGYATLPEELKRSVMILAAYYYENRETTINAPPAVEALISPFRAATF